MLARQLQHLLVDLNEQNRIRELVVSRYLCDSVVLKMARRRRQPQLDAKSADHPKVKRTGGKAPRTYFLMRNASIVIVALLTIALVGYAYYFLSQAQEDGETVAQPKAPSNVSSNKQSEQVSGKEQASLRLLQKPIPVDDPDKPHEKSINAGDTLLQSRKWSSAVQQFDKVLNVLPKSSRALYGKAVAVDNLSSEQRSNTLLDQCIALYSSVGLTSPLASTELQVAALDALAEKAEFRGKRKLMVKALSKLYHKLRPDDIHVAHRLGVAYLIAGQNAEAKNHFEAVLDRWPDDLYSRAHIGFVLYSDGKYEEAVPHLLPSIFNDTEIRKTSKFFVYAGDALIRLHRQKEARTVYQEAVDLGLFPNVWQRSTYNEPNLRSQPLWSPEETGYAASIRKLEEKWKTIRKEGLSVLDLKTGGFMLEEEGLREKGDWHQFTLYSRGRKDEVNCKRTPQTCAIVDSFPEAAGCTRGQVKFSVMHPGVHVWPHVGPTNCRLRMHLGLKIPDGVTLRVADHMRGWEEGKLLIFDDSYEHEVWHNGTETRLILIVDVWHPDIPKSRRKTLSPI